MPNLARRTVALAALAVAIIAAAAALDLPSATAEPPAGWYDGDRDYGRITARRLDDGRTEFGWLMTDTDGKVKYTLGESRVLPSSRYFPADARVGRWLRSSPVVLGDKEIGRINARLTDDGRIEFAFTPTDRGRILPPARYFPANARVDRWLRSTTIDLRPDSFTAVSAGSRHTCALHKNGNIECWGSNDYGQTEAPAGNDFIAVSAGSRHTCAIRESSAIECWGDNSNGRTDAPAGLFSAVDAGFQHACALRVTGGITCWGLGYYDGRGVPAGRFTAISAGVYHNCALRLDREIACWPVDDLGPYYGYGQLDAPAGHDFTAVSAGANHNCALRHSGEIACWGDNDHGQTDAPAP